MQNKPVPDNAVLITFDDGYASFYRHAYPILQSYGAVAACFLIVGYVNPQRKAGYLSWDEVREMKSRGFGFYSHSYCSHEPRIGYQGKPVNPLTNRLFLPQQRRLETEAEYVRRVKSDLLAAEETLRSELGNELSMLCFPHGIYNRRLIEIGDELGISLYFTGEEGLNPPHSRLIRRINAGSVQITPQRLLTILQTLSSL
nr:polysaccharide deacetylase family protein [Paenibacillus hamazuiensis]